MVDVLVAEITGVMIFVALFLIIALAFYYVIFKYKPGPLLVEAIVEAERERRERLRRFYNEFVRQVQSQLSISSGESMSKSLSFTCPDLSEIVDVGNLSDVKWFFREIFCKSSEPLAVLLVGPAASAKTLIAKSICDALGDECLFISAESPELTGAGLREVLFRYSDKVKLLVVDELDKARREVYELLLSLIDPLRRRIAKVHASSSFVTEVKLKVIATANSIDAIRERAGKELADALLSRFTIIHVKPYTTYDEYITALTQYLERKYGLDHEIAKYLAENCTRKRMDWRKIEQIAKLAKHIKTKDELDRLIRMVS